MKAKKFYADFDDGKDIAAAFDLFAARRPVQGRHHNSKTLREHRADLASFEEQESEPTLSLEELLNNLKAHGKL